MIVIHPNFPKIYSGKVIQSIPRGVIPVGSDVIVCFGVSRQRVKMISRHTNRTTEQVIESGTEWECFVFHGLNADNLKMSTAKEFIELTGYSRAHPNVSAFVQRRVNRAFMRGIRKS